MPFGRSRRVFRSAEFDLAGGEGANGGQDIGRAAAFVCPPRLSVLWNWPPGGRKASMRETLKPSAVFGPSPPLCVRRHSHPGGTQTNGGEIIERRCCLGEIVFLISSPESASRADDRNVSEELEPSITSAAAPLRLFPTEFTEKATRNRRPKMK